MTLQRCIGGLGENFCRKKKDGGMGFRDLASFNQAILAKQGWRVVQSPSSLMSRILKTTYFPKSHFLDAFIGSCPSYIFGEALYGNGDIEFGVTMEDWKW